MIWGALSGGLSILLCWGLIQIAPKDAPDGQRKQQPTAIPSWGGIGIAGATMCALLGAIYLAGEGYWVAYSNDVQYVGFGQLIAASGFAPYYAVCLIVILLGALDDKFHLPAKPKFAALLGLAVSAAWLGIHVDGVFLPVADAYFPLVKWLGVGGTMLWLFVMMNAANFMDGSNGLSLGTLAIMIGTITLNVSPPTEAMDHVIRLTALILVTSIFGFLFWNLQGQLYAGDAGSLFGGAVFASFGVYAAQDGNIWFPATLALPFLVDVFLTLIWRARTGHNLLTPHQDHAYQLFIRSGWGHIRTALLWWVMAAICASAALWAASDSKSTSAWMFLGLLGAGCALWLWQRRAYGPRAGGNT